MAKSRERRIAEAAEPTEAEVEFLKALVVKHGLEADERTSGHLMMLAALVQGVGFGRNAYTAKLLRVAADMLEADEIERIEEIEKRVDGKTH